MQQNVILRASLCCLTVRGHMWLQPLVMDRRSGIVRHSYGFMPSCSWFNRSKDSDHTFTFLSHYISILCWTAVAVFVCSNHIKHHAGHCRLVDQILSCFDDLHRWHFGFCLVIHPAFWQKNGLNCVYSNLLANLSWKTTWKLLNRILCKK